MSNPRSHHIKELLLPCLGFSVAAGFLSAVTATLFTFAAEKVIHVSNHLHEKAETNLLWILVFILGSAAIGLIASFLLSLSRTCRGGGIPTSVAAIKGMVSFNWLASIFLLPFSALLTFFCGLPLGTEGPCVQMGTAIGDGVIHCAGGKKRRGWRRYVMTGGASAGFAIATGAPVSAIIFSVEEIHKRLSPILLTVASISVVTSQLTARLLSSLGFGSTDLFVIAAMPAISRGFVLAPLIIGLVCGLSSIFFTRFYHFANAMMRKLLKKLSIRLVLPILFACVSAVGFLIAGSLGTGHSLVDTLLFSRAPWYMLILIFLIRAVFMTLSNTSGVTGGTFLPTLSFGAILGSLCAEVMILLGVMEPEHYTLAVVLGITAFLGATIRIPITACVFAIEAIGGVNNVLPLILATTVAMLTVELSGLEDFTDTLIEAKLHSLKEGKTSTVIEVPLKVTSDAFVIGKEMKDILWPISCVVLSIERANAVHGTTEILEGDVIKVHYETYDPVGTAEELSHLVGTQPEEIRERMLVK